MTKITWKLAQIQTLKISWKAVSDFLRLTKLIGNVLLSVQVDIRFMLIFKKIRNVVLTEDKILIFNRKDI